MTIIRKLKSFYSHNSGWITLLSYMVIFVPGLHGHSIIPFVLAIVYGTAMDLRFNLFSTLQIMLIVWLIALVVSWLRFVPGTIRLISTILLLGIIVFLLCQYARGWFNGVFTFWVPISFIPSVICHALNVLLTYSQLRNSRGKAQSI